MFEYHKSNRTKWISLRTCGDLRLEADKLVVDAGLSGVDVARDGEVGPEHSVHHIRIWRQLLYVSEGTAAESRK